MSTQPAVILVTGADLAAEALELLAAAFDRLCPARRPPRTGRRPAAGTTRGDHRYGAAPWGDAMDAAPSPARDLKHGSGTDTIDSDAARERGGIAVVAAAGATAAAVAEHAMALLLACAPSRWPS